MTSETQAVLNSWSTLGLDASLCLTAVVYIRGWHRIRIVFARHFPIWRLAAFLAGVAAVWFAIGSSLERLDEASLTVHMVEHLLLSAVAPPLILLGAPALLLLHGLPQALTHNIVSPLLRLRVVRRFDSFISNPAICWFAATIALLAWHVPLLFELALRWDWLHKLEHASFFGTGLMFWWPVVQPWPSTSKWPRWTIPLYLFCATLPCDALSGFLTFCDRVVYPSYLSAPRLFGLSPLEDQQCAAALMWISVTLIFLIPAVLVTLRILSPGGADLPEEPWSEWRKLIRKTLQESKPEVA
jgi:putative membrane protein